jgi:hypothetical protein
VGRIVLVDMVDCYKLWRREDVTTLEKSFLMTESLGYVLKEDIASDKDKRVKIDLSSILYIVKTGEWLRMIG